MTRVKVIGGLGNQLFQYCFYLALKKENCKKDFSLDIEDFNNYSLHNGYELERVFNLNEKYFKSAVKNRIYRKVIDKIFYLNYKERKSDYYKFNSKYLSCFNSHSIIDGYWQSLQYVELSRVFWEDKLIFPSLVTDKNIKLENICKRHQSVSLHVRRGDYINHESLGGICDLDYYEKAISYFKHKIVKPVFIVFSNDINWCVNNLPKDTKYIFVSWNVGNQSYIDMQLMSYCKHNIIANSSFSIWGAILNNNKSKTVVRPKRWINNKKEDELKLDNWVCI